MLSWFRDFVTWIHCSFQLYVMLWTLIILRWTN